MRLIGFMFLAALLACPAWADEAPGRVRNAELSPEVEAAITRGLEYLGKSQNTDGSWGGTYKSAETALSLMAFMVKGQFPGRGAYGARLDKAVAYLIRQGQQHEGYLGGTQQGMYEHGLATLALSEVWGESDRDEIRDVLKKAVEVTQKAQNSAGGWRYGPQPTDADISVTVMQIMALVSAKEAGISVPDDVLDRAVRYVKSCQHSLGGFAYMPGQQPGFARTAAGVMSLCMAGRRDSDSVRSGLEYLIRQPESKFTSVQFFYYAHYYAMQAMYQAGDGYYQKWYPQIRDALLPRQRPDGSFGGSDAATTPAYSTSMSVLILGVPYRFLPIYQR